MLEGFAFFIEAIFLGIYLYAWDRLPPRTHLLTGIPVCVAGVASTLFVVCANAWTNQPRGFGLEDGRVVDVDPWAAMFNPATPPQTVHMILAAFLVAGYGMAGVHAVAMLRGRRDRYHRLGFAVPFTVAAVLTPIQIGVGDWAAKFLATNQPAKLAAIEEVSRTTSGVPPHLGGVYVDGEMRYALEIPDVLAVGHRLELVRDIVVRAAAMVVPAPDAAVVGHQHQERERDAERHQHDVAPNRRWSNVRRADRSNGRVTNRAAR